MSAVITEQGLATVRVEVVQVIAGELRTREIDFLQYARWSLIQAPATELGPAGDPEITIFRELEAFNPLTISGVQNADLLRLQIPDADDGFHSNGPSGAGSHEARPRPHGQPTDAVGKAVQFSNWAAGEGEDPNVALYGSSHRK